MKFTKYCSIENTYRQKTIDSIVMSGFSGDDWFVQEKVHGSNFSLWYDGTTVKAGKKSSYVGEGDNFYNCWPVVTYNTPYIISLYNIMKIQDPAIDIVTVYGEIFGGSYPHPDVPRTQATVVQKGVFYCPDNRFYAFDIMITKGDTTQILDMDVTEELLKTCCFFYAKTLFRGSFQDALNYSNEFQTTIPKDLGLPEIPNNICEGVVIKPRVAKFFGCGSRVILKNKNSRFTEKEHKEPKDKKIQVQDINLSDDAKAILETMEDYVTENRLRNVLSHVGGMKDHKEFGKILGAFCKDVFDDFMKDHQESFDTLGADEQKSIRKILSNTSTTMLRSNILNIIDGNF
jgi:Rnl2 family RNA ligase